MLSLPVGRLSCMLCLVVVLLGLCLGVLVACIRLCLLRLVGVLLGGLVVFGRGLVFGVLAVCMFLGGLGRVLGVLFAV